MPRDFNDKLISDILLSVTSNNYTFNKIQGDTCISPRILRDYLEHMKSERLILEDSKNWHPHEGKSKSCRLTEKGIRHLINTSLFNLLEVITKLLDQAKTPEMQNLFLKTRTDQVNHTNDLIKKHFQNCVKRGVDPFKELESLDDYHIKRRFRTSSFQKLLTDMDMPLYQAVEKLFELQLFFNFQDPNPQDTVNNHWAIFSPKMLLFLMYIPGSKPELDRIFYEIKNASLYSYEAMKSRSENALHSRQFEK